MFQDIVVQTAQMCPVISQHDGQQHCLYSICLYKYCMTFSCQTDQMHDPQQPRFVVIWDNVSLHQAALLLNLLIGYSLWIFMSIFNHVQYIFLYLAVLYLVDSFS